MMKWDFSANMSSEGAVGLVEVVLGAQIRDID
jgi:hypothetical protein